MPIVFDLSDRYANIAEKRDIEMEANNCSLDFSSICIVDAVLQPLFFVIVSTNFRRRKISKSDFDDKTVSSRFVTIDHIHSISSVPIAMVQCLRSRSFRCKNFAAKNNKIKSVITDFVVIFLKYDFFYFFVPCWWNWIIFKCFFGFFQNTRK